MKKRNFIKEIEGIKANLLERESRIGQAFIRWFDVLACLATLEDRSSDSEEFKVLKQAISHYAPICGVACLEGYFRLLVKDLIDYGPPFSVNAQEFSDVKFSILEINAIRDKRITVGEFIAHLLPMNNLSDINSHMTILLSEDLIKLVRCSVPTGRRVGNQILPETRTNEELYPNMIKDLAKVFEVRHVLCHELATAYRLDIEDIGKMYSNVMSFINTVEYLISQRMRSSK